MLKKLLRFLDAREGTVSVATVKDLYRRAFERGLPLGYDAVVKRGKVSTPQQRETIADGIRMGELRSQKLFVSGSVTKTKITAFEKANAVPVSVVEGLYPLWLEEGYMVGVELGHLDAFDEILLDVDARRERRQGAIFLTTLAPRAFKEDLRAHG